MITDLILCVLVVVLHECAHAGTAWCFGVSVADVKFTWFGVGVQLTQQVPGWRGALVSLAGPAVNLVMLPFLVPYPYALQMSAAMVLVNMLPVKQADGFRAWVSLTT